MEGPVHNHMIVILDETRVLIPLDDKRSAIVSASALREFAERNGEIIESLNSDDVLLNQIL